MGRKKLLDIAGETDYLSFTEFMGGFSSESDRAAVILGAARIDLGLYHVLQHVMLPNTSKSDDLLEGDSPLSTFSARINICHRLGLIDAKLTRSLHLIRKIRNIFAHETSGSSLNSGSHRDRVRELCSPFLEYKTYVPFRDKHFSKFEGASRDFRAITALIVMRLDGAMKYLHSFRDDDPIVRLIPPHVSNPKDKTVYSKAVLGAEDPSAK
jgi:hypothetical protein